MLRTRTTRGLESILVKRGCHEIVEPQRINADRGLDEKSNNVTDRATLRWNDTINYLA
jgi:hypothetical protein